MRGPGGACACVVLVITATGCSGDDDDGGGDRKPRPSPKPQHVQLFSSDLPAVGPPAIVSGQRVTFMGTVDEPATRSIGL